MKGENPANYRRDSNGFLGGPAPLKEPMSISNKIQTFRIQLWDNRVVTKWLSYKIKMI